MTKFQQSDIIGPTTSAALAAGAKVIIDSKRTPPELDAYLVYFGNSISVQADAPFTLFRIKVNGAAFVKPFDNLTSQFGSIALPTRLPAPQFLGRGVLVELEGEQLVGASGANLLAATAGLVYVKPGEKPNA